MNRIALLPALLLASFVHHDSVAATGGTKTVDAEAKMFTMSAGYERFMGRWSRILAPAFVAFAGVKDGDRVLDIGTGTGALASAVEAATKSSEIVGIDPSEGLIS
jgi:ubiquinone/menaquinone biosynthesis C-methylase UbiE